MACPESLAAIILVEIQFLRAGLTAITAQDGKENIECKRQRLPA